VGPVLDGFSSANANRQRDRMALGIKTRTNEENLFDRSGKPCSVQEDERATVCKKSDNVRENEDQTNKVIVFSFLKREICTRIVVD
jgi:hypothetical protein